MACVVLASGLSERFGATDKLQADLRGKPLLQHTLDMVAAVAFGEVVLVSQSTLASGTTFVGNDNPEAGQGHALRLGIKAALEADWSHVMVVLGDMPLVTSAHIEAMIEAATPERALVSLAEGRRLPPVIFPKSAMKHILAQSSASGAKAIFDQLDPATLPMDPRSALDVDTPEDLARVAEMMKQRTT